MRSLIHRVFRRDMLLVVPSDGESQEVERALIRIEATLSRFAMVTRHANNVLQFDDRGLRGSVLVAVEGGDMSARIVVDGRRRFSRYHQDAIKYAMVCGLLIGGLATMNGARIYWIPGITLIAYIMATVWVGAGNTLLDVYSCRVRIRDAVRRT